MKTAEFVEKYCRWADYYYGEQVLALLEKKNYDCILWENGCSAECPGMNKGKTWTYEEILKNKNAYDQNKPLTRQEVEKLIEEDREK